MVRLLLIPVALILLLAGAMAWSGGGGEKRADFAFINRGDIITLVIRQALTVTAIGLAAGLLSGLAAARSLGSMLYGVPPWDPLSVGGAALVLLLTGLIAGYLPARRAARTDPARTLAAE